MGEVPAPAIKLVPDLLRPRHNTSASSRREFDRSLAGATLVARDDRCPTAQPFALLLCSICSEYPRCQGMTRGAYRRSASRTRAR